MAPVFSRPLCRAPNEDYYEARCGRERPRPRKVWVPLHLLRGTVLAGRQTPVPTCCWREYVARMGIQNREVARCLVGLISPLPRDVMVRLVEQRGLDAAVVKCWILEEERHNFVRHLNEASSEMKVILPECLPAGIMCAISEDRLRAAVDRFLSAGTSRGRSLACWHCQEPTTPGRVCVGCLRARYCSEACQKWDWEAHRGRCKLW